MLDVLKFVKGAVGKKDLVPALTHFRIEGGRITGYNGKVSLSSPIALDVDCCPKAVALVRAIEACTETAQLHVTPTGKLSIRSGKFRANVDTVELELFPGVEPTGITVVPAAPLLPSLAGLYGFSSDDASKPWASGVLLDGSFAYATNNVILAEYWIGCHFPYRANIPRYAVKEILRISEEPTHIQMTANSITFHYEGERWLMSQLISHDWPDVTGLFAKIPPTPEEVRPVPEGFWEALATLEPFVDDMNHVYMMANFGLATAQDSAQASVDFPILEDGLYNHKMLSLLAGVASRIGFDHYPAPVPWYGAAVRGLLMGMRA